ncbi:uncharacterized protein LOC118598729 [Oryzias melastigma]|uniref:uncharacterized protein LOC118598729 n=1 Tax=Oryzias melastigma TaxID=30732 RepID=UPI00168D7DAC|nr:uncharacterized protein LOC118598729 [Oryzias melastigma]
MPLAESCRFADRFIRAARSGTRRSNPAEAGRSGRTRGTYREQRQKRPESPLDFVTLRPRGARHTGSAHEGRGHRPLSFSLSCVVSPELWCHVCSAGVRTVQSPEVGAEGQPGGVRTCSGPKPETSRREEVATSNSGSSSQNRKQEAGRPAGNRGAAAAETVRGQKFPGRPKGATPRGATAGLFILCLKLCEALHLCLEERKRGQTKEPNPDGPRP